MNRTNEQIAVDCILKFRLHGAAKIDSIYMTEALFFTLNHPGFKQKFGIAGVESLKEAIQNWKPE